MGKFKSGESKSNARHNFHELFKKSGGWSRYLQLCTEDKDEFLKMTKTYIDLNIPKETINTLNASDTLIQYMSNIPRITDKDKKTEDLEVLDLKPNDDSDLESS